MEKISTELRSLTNSLTSSLRTPLDSTSSRSRQIHASVASVMEKLPNSLPVGTREKALKSWLSILNIMQNWQRRRKMQGLTQAELANLIGISRTALSHIERGKSQPSRSTQESLERALNPFLNLIRFRCGEGAVGGSEILQKISAKRGLTYAQTLDVPTWLLTRYQTPGAAWAYVLRLQQWVDALTELGVSRASEAERADLILLRGTTEIMDESTVVQGLRIASVRRVMEDCAELSGRHALDAARLFLAYPRERPSRFRLDPAAVVKVWEDVLWT